MMRLVLPDVISTFTNKGAPIAKTAINALVDLKISPAQGGAGIAAAAFALGEDIANAMGTAGDCMVNVQGQPVC